MYHEKSNANTHPEKYEVITNRLKHKTTQATHNHPVKNKGNANIHLVSLSIHEFFHLDQLSRVLTCNIGISIKSLCTGGVGRDISILLMLMLELQVRGRQCRQVVRAQDLKSGSHRFKSHSDHWSCFEVDLGSNSSLLMLAVSSSFQCL